MLKKYVARKRLLVDHTVQRSLLFSLVFQWTIFLGIALGVSFATQLYIGIGVRSIYQIVWASLQQQAATLFAAAVLVPCFFRSMLIMSNRFAGPIQRLRKSIRDLAETGNCDDISFRSDDYWQELTHEFNHLRAEFLIVQQVLEQRKQTDEPSLEPMQRTA